MQDRAASGRAAAIAAVGFMALGPSFVKKVAMDEMAFVVWRLAVAALLYGIAVIASGKRRSLDTRFLRALKTRSTAAKTGSPPLGCPVP